MHYFRGKNSALFKGDELMSKKITRAVIVEDSLPMQKLIHMVLQSFGAEDIIVVNNGVECLNALQLDKVDIVVMDWNMPVMDGIECTRMIRSGVYAVDKNMPIVLLTANVGRSDEAYDAGVSGYIEKPFSLKSLHDGISAILHKS
jgi:two-component system chemotaxis response regulator CheY